MSKYQFMWIPLSLIIFGAYALQRGLISFSKTTMVVPWLSDAFLIFFLTIAIGICFCGIILDNVSSRKVILVATIFGSVGLLSLSYSPWGFGIGFGICAALVKIAPFSSPMKLINSKEEYWIIPQSASKNLGAAFFVFVIGSYLSNFSWSSLSIIMSLFILVIGIFCYFTIPDDKIQGWKLKIFLQLIKSWKFWGIMVYSFFMSGLLYFVLPKLIPALVQSGLSKSNAILILGISYILTAFSRLPAAWFGRKFGHWPVMILALCLAFITSLFLTIVPVTATIIFTCLYAVPSPNFWPALKRLWSSKYEATVAGLCFTSMYIGASLFKFIL